MTPTLGTRQEQEEKWRDISQYEGKYQVSSHGRIKSIPRMIKMPQGTSRLSEEKILSTSPNQKGYSIVKLCTNNKVINRAVHSLVAEAFLPKRPKGLVIDHIDEDKANNKETNLCYTTNRKNVSKSINKKQTSSKFIGVYKIPAGRGRLRNDRWSSKIRINNSNIHLGCYNTEIEAALAYQKTLISYGLL